MTMALGSFASRVVATAVVATDGTGDFTDIQEAIDSLPSGGGVVYIKEGTHTITTELTIPNSNIALIGAGRSTEIKTTSNISMLRATSKSGLLVSQILFTGSGSGNANNHAIIWTTVIDSVIKDCWIENAGGFGILCTSNCNNIKIINNTISSIANRALSIAATSETNIIMGNTVTSTNLDGLHLAGCSRTIVIGNTFESCGDNGLLMGAGSNKNIIQGNIFSNNIDDGIDVSDNCDDNVFSGNVSTGNDYGIFISSVSNDNNTVIGNQFLGNTTSNLTNNGTNTQLGHNVTA